MIDVRDLQQIAFLTYLNNGTSAIENDSMGKPIYIGYAKSGTDKSKIGWQIRKITYDSNNTPTDVQFANGTIEFDKIWDRRALDYTYS